MTAVNSATSVVFETTTNDGGAYTIGALPPGQYTVRFMAPGFKEAVRQNIVLDSGTIARVDPTLELGAVSDQVQVTTEAPLLDTETALNSESVNSKVFSDLPLSFGGGRNMAVFADRDVSGYPNHCDRIAFWDSGRRGRRHTSLRGPDVLSAPARGGFGTVAARCGRDAICKVSTLAGRRQIQQPFASSRSSR